MRTLGQHRRVLSKAEDDFALQLVKKLDCPVILVLNKIDALPKSALLPLIAHWTALHDVCGCDSDFGEEEGRAGAAAGQGGGAAAGRAAVFPEGPVDRPAGAVSGGGADSREDPDADGRRGSVCDGGGDRDVEEPATLKKDKDGKLPVTKIAAAIFCEREGQKAILIGKQGAMLKQIGTAARKDIEGAAGDAGVPGAVCEGAGGVAGSRGFVEDLDWRRQLEQIAEKQHRTARRQRRAGLK